jgi:PIN domain nuclease of toxin-antitoxin system
VRLLLDTHVLLWAAVDPERLGDTAGVLEDPDNQLLVSAASSWEIAVKYALDKLQLPEPPERYVPYVVRELAATPVAVEHAHALAVASLPHHHRDPFDRMLVAQAQLLRVPIVTADGTLDAYDVDVLLVG